MALRILLLNLRGKKILSIDDERPLHIDAGSAVVLCFLFD